MSPNAETWVGEPLPRGRHKLDRDAVRASQRGRLVRAMLELVAEQGYESTSVPAVVARARVSRNAFYALFDDKTDCFLAACDRITDDLLRDLFALDVRDDWIAAVAEGAELYVRWWLERPALTATYFVGIPAAGARALEQRQRNYAAFERLFAQLADEARAQETGLPALHPIVLRILVLAITELVAERVRAGAIEQLPELAPVIGYLIVKLLADESAAQRIVGQSR
jgi:AcrR family transcriptional regulator